MLNEIKESYTFLQIKISILQMIGAQSEEDYVLMLKTNLINGMKLSPVLGA